MLCVGVSYGELSRNPGHVLSGVALMKFAETFVNNRDVTMNVVNTVADAEKWLTGKPR